MLRTMSQDAEADVPLDEKPKLTVVVEYAEQQCTVKVKANTPFKKIFDAAEKRFDKDPGTLKFFLANERLRPEQTPLQMGMEDNDIIDAHIAQEGGASSRY